jgi:hypothetical protein
VTCFRAAREAAHIFLGLAFVVPLVHPRERVVYSEICFRYHSNKTIQSDPKKLALMWKLFSK